MTRNFDILDADGKVIDTHIVPDGGSVKVKMIFMDAAMVDAAAITRQATDAQLLHRPGFLTSLTDVEINASEAARDARKAALGDAWKNPPALLDGAAAAKQAAPGITTDSEARYEARDKRLENAWRGAA